MVPNLPAMSAMLCRNKLMKGKSCTFPQCRYRHIERFSDLNSNDQKILFDFVEMNTELKWTGTPPTRPDEAVQPASCSGGN